MIVRERDVEIHLLLRLQCDQKVRLFFNIWPFAKMKIGPIIYQIRQSRLNILTNEK